MELIKVVDVDRKTAARVRQFQYLGRLKKYEKDGYAAFDIDEWKNFKFKKNGRPIKK